MNDAFDLLSKFLAAKIGVALDIRRRSMIEARLAPVMENWRLNNIQELVQGLTQNGDPELLNQTIDAVVTCETLFFRDRSPFDALRGGILPKLHEARAQKRAIRIWSAACATGQEPYSIAMLLDELARDFVGWRIDLVATDVSQSALATAASGRYSQFEVQRGLSTPMLLRHFRNEDGMWRINEHLRASVDFRCVNLLSDFSRHGHFDVVFCRNVLMYMDVDRRSDVLARIARQLAPDGYLVLGAAETIVGLSAEFEPAPGYAGLFTRAPFNSPKLRLVVNS